MSNRVMSQQEIDVLVQSLEKEYGSEYTSFIGKKKVRVRNKARMKKLVLAN